MVEYHNKKKVLGYLVRQTIRKKSQNNSRSYQTEHIKSNSRRTVKRSLLKLLKTVKHMSFWYKDWNKRHKEHKGLMITQYYNFTISNAKRPSSIQKYVWKRTTSYANGWHWYCKSFWKKKYRVVHTPEHGLRINKSR